jgi:hypothetical protein
MNVKVLSINPAKEIRTFDVVVLIGVEQHQFTMTVETDIIAHQEIQVTNGDEHFLKTFKFNQRVALGISKLVSKVYNGQAVELPADIGEFYPKEIASYGSRISKK